MILSDRDLRKTQADYGIVEPFRDEHVQPASIDLRLGDQFIVWADNGRDPFIKDASGKAVVYDHAAPNWFQASHIARHDPARVLCEVQAKRAMMELHGRSHECSTYDHHGDIESCSWCLNPEDCSTLLALAAIYSDHPDYRKEWAA